MTITYDPSHPAYYDAADARAERDRVFDLCHGCRLCWNLCPSFESLFDLIDTDHNDDPKALTDAEHDRVVGECYNCKLCYVKCPYVPPHEWALDFPRLMMRSLAVKAKQQGVGVTERFLASTDQVGTWSTMVAPLVNAANRSPFLRGVLQSVVGISKQRLLPDYAYERFSRWFARWLPTRKTQGSGARQVALFTTCMVEYQQPAIGKDLVRVCDRNEIGVTLPEGIGCCGMPWLDGGDVDRFRACAERNVRALKPLVDAGHEIVVPQPTCGYVLKKEYPEYLKTDAAKAVAEHTFDASEYLVNQHRAGQLDTNFEGGTTYETITWHAPCHLRAQNIGFRSRDLMQITGARVKLAEGCSGIDGTWGYRQENYDLAKKIIQPLKRNLEKSGGDLVVGDCHLSNTAIFEETGRQPVHPVQVLARAYGIPEE